MRRVLKILLRQLQGQYEGVIFELFQESSMLMLSVNVDVEKRFLWGGNFKSVPGSTNFLHVNG